MKDYHRDEMLALQNRLGLNAGLPSLQFCSNLGDRNGSQEQHANQLGYSHRNSGNDFNPISPRLTENTDIENVMAKLNALIQADREKEKHAASAKWLQANRERYRGMWVALDGGKLLASGPDAVLVYREARKLVSVPQVEQIPASDSPFGGW